MKCNSPISRRGDGPGHRSPPRWTDIPRLVGSDVASRGASFIATLPRYRCACSASLDSPFSFATASFHPSADLEGISLYIPAGSLRSSIHTELALENVTACWESLGAPEFPSRRSPPRFVVERNPAAQ